MAKRVSKVRQVSDAEVAGMAGVSTAAVNAAEVTNEKSSTSTVLPWIRFTPEAQTAYNRRTFGEVKFEGLQISLSKRLASGSATQAQDQGRPLFCAGRGDNGPNFNINEGQPVIDVDVDLLQTLIGDVKAHRATLPVGPQEAFKASQSYRSTMDGSEVNGWPGLRKTNRRADFTEADALAQQAQAKFRQVRDSSGRDYREVVSLFSQAETLARTIGRDDTLRIVRHELNQLEAGEAKKSIESNVAIAIDQDDVDQSRRDLVKVMQELQGMYGCQHPDYTPRSSNERRGGNDRHKPAFNTPSFRRPEGRR